jgi:hypothetical protein
VLRERVAPAPPPRDAGVLVARATPVHKGGAGGGGGRISSSSDGGSSSTSSSSTSSNSGGGGAGGAVAGSAFCRVDFAAVLHCSQSFAFAYQGSGMRRPRACVLRAGGGGGDGGGREAAADDEQPTVFGYSCEFELQR